MDKRRRDNASIVMASIVVGIIVALVFIWVVNGRPQIGVGSSSPSPSVAAHMSPGTSAGASSGTSAHPSVNPSTGAVHVGDPKFDLTPGVINPDVTQANIATTICKSGWTATIRPPSSYTTKLKITQIAQYGYTDTKTASYEEDHLISLELGGAPKDAKNLWPEPYVLSWQGHDLGAHVKDQYENWLKAQVCAKKMTLAAAQHDIATDWAGNWLASGAPNSTSTDNSDD